MEKRYINLVLVKTLISLLELRMLDDTLISAGFSRVKRLLNKMEFVGEERRLRLWKSKDHKKTLDIYSFKTEEILYLIAKRSVELIYNQLSKGDTIENQTIVIGLEYAFKIVDLETKSGALLYTDPILEVLKNSK